MTGSGLEKARQKMREAGQHEEAIAAFADAYERVSEGQATLLPSSDLAPAEEVSRLEELEVGEAEEALAGVAVVKLNGGLATTMGLQGPSRWWRRGTG